MKTIRQCSFETNSSSTHAIVIAKDMGEMECYTNYDEEYGFGREIYRLVDHFDEKLAYIYYLVKSLYTNEEYKDDITITTENTKEIRNFKTRTYNIYDKYIKLIKEQDKYINEVNLRELFKKFDALYIDYSLYVDHSEDFIGKYKCYDFIDKILNDDDFYAKFLFSKESYITVGGDEYCGYNIKTIGFQYDYKEECINKGTEEEPVFEDVGEFWNRLEEYKKTHDVYLKGN